jgi:outer membrane protein
VAQVALDNTQARLAQVDGFVRVGTRPEIDLAQVRADVANARLQLLYAKNAYAVARARLVQAMGVDANPTFEVRGDELPAVDGEGGEVAVLLGEALAARPEAQALEAQVKAQVLTLRATRAAYWPSLGVQLGGTLAARQLPTIVPNLSAQVTLNWAFYEGGLTLAQEREAEAQMLALEAQRDALKLDVRLEVEQALLDVSAAREGVEVAGEVLVAAQEKLRLADGRYRAGAGSALELSDAQVGATQASAQVVQARFALATARAALLAALGRE